MMHSQDVGAAGDRRDGHDRERHEATPQAAGEALRRLAHGLDGDEDARVARLLERVASGGAELRDALVVEGARAVVRGARR